MKLFRLALAIAWLAVMWLSYQAIFQLGTDQAGAIFLGDFAHPWRAQFNGDFSVHLLLMAVWIVWREKKWWARVVLPIAAILFGGAFSLAYIFVATYTSNNSIGELLLGRKSDDFNR